METENDESNSAKAHECTQNILKTPLRIEETDNRQSQGIGPKQEGLEEPEKSDFSPEDSAKNALENAIVENESTPGLVTSFTIDFSDGSSKVDDKRHKTMVERFQRRQKEQQNNKHRRGQSIGGLKTDISPEETTITNIPNQGVPANGVTMRNKPQNQSRNADLEAISKRHSWSPKTTTTMQSPIVIEKPNTIEVKSKIHTMSPLVPVQSKQVHIETLSIQAKSQTLQLALQNKMINLTDEQQKDVKSNQHNIRKDDWLQDVAIGTPLEYEETPECVSETGTYTLDGDNYTEEQKDKMNIDKAKAKAAELEAAMARCRNKLGHHLPENKNVLEISYSHEPTSFEGMDEIRPHKKTSYLEKIKSRVQKISDKTFNKSSTTSTSTSKKFDVGTFTSVTTSGILSKGQIPEAWGPTDKKVLARRNSLTRSHIDASEYVQRKKDDFMTDNEKAEYQLNIFLKSNFEEPSSLETQRPKRREDANQTDDDAASSLISVKTKNDWIQEWAKNARKQIKSPVMSNSYDAYENSTPTLVRRPPQSPSKIPSPIQSAVLSPLRARSVSRTRPPLSPSGQHANIPTCYGSNNDIPSHFKSSLPNDFCINNLTMDTDHFLERTAAAITSLQSVLHQQKQQRQKQNQNYHTSPQSDSQPPTPTSPMSSAAVHNMNMSTSFMTSMSSPGRRPNRLNCSQKIEHRRNLSLDAGTPYYDFQRGREHESNSDKMLNRYNSAKNALNQKANELLSIKQRQNNVVSAATSSPIRRSSSFSAQTRTNAIGVLRQANKAAMPSPTNEQKTFNDHYLQHGIGQLQKSQSSTSFRRFMTQQQVHQQNASQEFYVNEQDNLDDSYYHHQSHPKSNKHNAGNSLSSSSCEDFNFTNQSDSKMSDDSECPTSPSYQSKTNEHLSNTRVNKTFLKRVEQNRAKAATATAQSSIRGCPNTPEMPRRQTNRQNVTRDRQSMPRDSSLQRMKQDLNNFNQTKKTLNTNSSPSPAASKKVQPKYLDISKYKPVQSNNFLKRDGSKITKLGRESSAPPTSAPPATQNFLKKSPSCTGIMNRSDATRTSVRSVKSASGGTKSAAALAAANAQKVKEQELAMWRRRASYDPMKAAAEGKRKEIAKKQQLLE